MLSIKIKQRDATDCGAACLASIAAHYKIGVPVAKVRQYACTDKEGTNILGLIKAANAIGLNAKGVKGGKDAIPLIPLPAIAHIIYKIGENQMQHYVVIYKVCKNHLMIMDPRDGKLLKVTKEKFFEEWTGVLVLLEPKPNKIPHNEIIPLWKRFVNLANPHKSVIIQALVGAILYTIIGLATSIYLEKITDHVLVDGNTNLLNILSIVMLFLLLLRMIVGIFQNKLVLKTGQLIDCELILGYYQHLLHLPQTFFDTMRIGEITSRIGDAVKIRNFINQTAVNLFVNSCIIVFSFCLMFTYFWKLALIVLIIIPLYTIIYIITDKWNKLVERKVMEKSADLEGLLVESLNGVKTIKQYGSEKYFEEKTENKFISLLYKVYSSANNSIFSGISTGFITSFFTIILLWAGSYYVLDGFITAGELMSFYALIGYFTGPIASIISANKEIRNATIAADRLFEIMDLQIEQQKGDIELTPDIVGDIEFKNVSFSYGTRKNIFSDFNLSIKKGSLTAIVGESGSGKTTIASILQNLYPIKEGKILIGGNDIKYISNESLRKVIATVPQQINLFAGTIIQNIALGEYEPNLKKIIQLADLLGLTDFITSLPEGYETNIGENGALLSGGQKQRLAIMRALYKNPEILILDEATSSLDSVSEQYVQNTINLLKENGKTIIVIAHRLSTIRNADDIVVIKNGSAIEHGTYNQLMQKDGEFIRLWNNQIL